MKLNALQKRTLRLEQLENRELLSATTWNDAAQADAAVAAEMAAVLNADAPIDMSAFSAAEVETTAEEAKTWLVTSTFDDGNEGTLRYAVENAGAGDTIKFDASLQDATIALSKPIVVDKALTISAYDLYRFEDLPNLIYDVDCAGLTLNGQGSTRIFELAEGADLSLIGVKMTNGSICGAWTSGDALPAGLDENTPMTSEYHGGAVYVPEGAKLSLEACVLSNSRSIGGGGAIAAAGEIRASNTIFEGNDGGAHHGGAIRVFDGFVEVVDCYFRGNKIVATGLYSGGGGAVSANGGVFRSINTLYSGNSAWYGGAFFVAGGDVHLSNSLVVENGAPTQGSQSLVGCNDGGGINVDSGNLTIVNSTIARNIAGYRGSGILANSRAGHLTVKIYNSIIAENISDAGSGDGSGSAADIDVHEGWQIGSYWINGYSVDMQGRNNLSTFDGWDLDEGNIVYDKSQPLFTEANGPKYALAEGSPAIDAGNVEYAVLYGYDADGNWGPTANPIEYDFIRYVRVIDDKIDIGALESGSVPYYEAIRAPENVAFSGYDAKAGTVVVTWEDKSYAELGFRVEISTDGENWTWAAQVGENVEAATLSGIEPNTTYFVRVRAERDLSDVSEWSEVADFTATARPLAAPVVEPKATSSTEITFAINEVEGAVRYVYEYSANADFSDATRGERLTSGMQTISGLQPYTQYYFRAYAVGSGLYLDSPWSSTLAKTEQAVLPAPTPSVALGEDDATSLKFSFNAVENATSYVYRYSTSADFADATTVTTATATAGSFVIPNLEPGEQYYFQAKAIGGGAYVDSEWSTAISATTDAIDLPAPSVSVEAIGTTTLDFNVGAVANATSYYYRFATSEADLANATPVILDAAGKVALSGLDANATYYFQAAAVGDGVGYRDSVWSAPVSATTLKIVLNAPSVSATPVDFSTITFNIGFVANAENGYVYEYSTSADFSNATPGETNKFGSFDVSGLKPATTYYFRAKAVGTGAYENSDWSETASATTPKINLATPKIDAVATSSTSIDLTINPVDYATGYYCEYSADPNFGNVLTAMAGAETIEITGLEPHTTYYFRVLAYGGDVANVSDWATDNETTLQAKLSAPQPTLALGGTGALTLSFEAVPNAKSYVYRYSTSPDFANATTATATSAGSLTVRNLAAGQTYYFQTAAVGDGDKYLDSDWSSAISATTSKVNLPAPPVAIQTVGSTTLSFSFESVANASSYEYRYATTQDGLETATAKSASDGTFELTGLNPVTTYYVQMRAIGNGTNYVTSEWSTAVDATTVKIVLDVPQVGAAAVDASKITFEIEEVANADAYVYEYSTSRYFTAETTTSGTATSAGSFDVSGLSPFTTYYFRAKAVVDAEKNPDKAKTHESSAWSTEAFATTEKAALLAPKISAVALDTTTLALTIEPVANAGGYAYLMSTDPSFDGAEPVASGSGTIALTGLTPGATYYFKAMAKAKVGGAYVDSDWSAPKSATMQFTLATPTISAVATGVSAITLTFGDLDANASGYVYQVATTDGAWRDDAWVVAELSETGTLTVDGLDANTTYYFVAKAIGSETGAYANSEVSSSTSATTLYLAAPTDVSFSQYHVSADSFDTYLRVRWSVVENAVGYVVEYRETGASEWTGAQKSTGKFTQIYGLTPGKTYDFRVCAQNEFGDFSDWSDLASVAYLSAPTAELVGYDPETGSAEFSWSSVEAAQRYRLEFSKVPFVGSSLSKNGADCCVLVFNSSVTSRAYASLEAGQTYYFRVRAHHDVDAKGAGAWSNVATFEALTAPTDVVFAADSDDPTCGVLSWTNTAANATSFRVEVSTDGENWERSLTTSASGLGETSLRLDSLTPGELYYFRVQAQNANGLSDWTNGSSIAAPTDISFSQYHVSADSFDTYLRVGWSVVENAVGYVVEYRETGSSEWTGAQKSTGKFAKIYGLTPGKSYDFRVCAQSKFGDFSDWSDLASVAYLSAPTAELVGYDPETGRVEFSWSSVEAAQRYRLEFSKVPFVGSSLSKNGADCRVLVFNSSVTSRAYVSLEAGQTYYFRVRAHHDVDAKGAGAWSNVVEFVVPASASSTSNVISQALVDFFAEESSDDDFWFEFEKALSGRK